MSGIYCVSNKFDVSTERFPVLIKN